MEPKTIDLESRRTENTHNDHHDLERFVTALAESLLPDGDWYAIESITMVEKSGGVSEYRVSVSDDFGNAIGNKYPRTMLEKGYAMVGFSNHWDESDDDIDRISFTDVRIEPRQELGGIREPVQLNHETVQERLNEIGIEYRPIQ